MKQKIFLACFVFLWVACLPMQGLPAEDSGQLRRLKKRVLKLQLETHRFKSELGSLVEKWTEQKEKSDSVIAALTLENEKLSKKVTEVVRKSEILEENLDAYRAQSASVKVAEVEKIVAALLLEAVGEPQRAEAAVLALINEGSEDLPKDLFILFLAERKKQSGELEKSLGYLGALVSDFPESPYLLRGIFEMSELLGRLGKTQEQHTLLRQLALGNDDDEYVKKAKEKLNTLPGGKTSKN